MGRALVAVLAPLPGVAITWVDVAADRFPADVPDGVTVLPAADPARLADHAPRDAEHLVLTFSHALDLELCHRLLGRGFARLRADRVGDEMGAVPVAAGSTWAMRAAQVARIDCPIGDPALGKHPQAIAVGVAAEFLGRTPQIASRGEAG